MSDLIAVHPDTGRTRRATSERHYQLLLDNGWKPQKSKRRKASTTTSAAAEVSDEPEPQQED